MKGILFFIKRKKGFSYSKKDDRDLGELTELDYYRCHPEKKEKINILFLFFV